ncbi:MAG: hypothetical protein WC775_03810 [Patescibacteria group bacterium]|jgi:hypothetical protein
MKKVYSFGKRLALFFIVVTTLVVMSASPSQADDLSITGSVPPKPSDVDFAINGAPSVTTTLHESDTVVVTITYRSHLVGSEDFHIQASWNKGLVQGSNNNYVDVFNYVVGSATASDDGTLPVVDLLNNHIIWDIPNLAPSSSFHTVSFSLKVPGTLPTLIPLTASINAQGQIISTTLPQQSLNYTVQGLLEPTTIPTPTTLPTTTPTTIVQQDSITQTPTPSIAPVSPEIKNVSVRDITDSESSIYIETSPATQYTIRYGSTKESLDRISTTASFHKQHIAQLTKLTPGTTYYFRVTVTTTDNLSTTSDLFTLTTARTADIIPLTKEDVSLAWNQIPVAEKETSTITVPFEQPITASIHINNPQQIRFISMRFQNKHVLGVSSTDTALAVEEVRLIEVLPHVFSGQLAAPRVSGEYQALLEIHSVNGAISTQSLPYSIIVSPAITVVDALSSQPVENALVEIERYDKNSRQYTKLQTSFAIINHTNDKGTLPIILPNNTYRIDVHAPGYKSASVTLKLGSSDMFYPVIKLQPSYTVADRIHYYSAAVTNTADYISRTLKEFFSSNLAKEAVFTVTTVTALFLALIVLSGRMNVGIFGLLYSPFALLWRMFLQNKNDYLTLHVSEHFLLGKRIAGAVVLMVDNSGKRLFKLKTNPQGAVHIAKKNLNSAKYPVKVFLYRPEYYAYPIVFDKTAFSENTIELAMEPEIIDVYSVRTFVRWFIARSRFVISDLLMFTATLLVCVFTIYHGIVRSAPLLLVTGLLICVWAVYVYHRFERDEMHVLE